mgnify:CR=1 FL=1
MNLILLFKKIQPYVRPYKWLVVLTLILTLIGSFIAQINAVVLDRTVDAINELIMTHDLEWKNAAHILTIISINPIINSAPHNHIEKIILYGKNCSMPYIDRYSLTLNAVPHGSTALTNPEKINVRPTRIRHTFEAIFNLREVIIYYSIYLLTTASILRNISSGVAISSFSVLQSTTCRFSSYSAASK